MTQAVPNENGRVTKDVEDTMSKKKSKGNGVEKATQTTQDLQDLESRFFEAIKSDNEEIVAALLENRRFKSYVIEADKLSLAFVQVVLLNNVRLLKILVEHGVDAMGTDCMFEENGIMHAARYGHQEMLAYLLSSGVNINHQSENGSTAIHIAVENQRHGCLEVLVKQKGVDVNIQDCSGFSPLLWSARLRDWRAMEILIDAGCNIESKDYCKGINALHICVDNERAFWKGRQATAEDIVKCIDLLVDAGIDINKGDIYGNSALVYAVKSNNLHAMKHLLQLNCDVECIESIEGNCRPHSFVFTTEVQGTDMTLIPLYLAISKLRLRSVQILCTAGAKYYKLAREPAILDYCSDRCPSLKDWLEAAISTPMSLKLCCRQVVKQHLGKNVIKTVSKTGLPASLQELVCLEDIDKM